MLKMLLVDNHLAEVLVNRVIVLAKFSFKVLNFAQYLLIEALIFLSRAIRRDPKVDFIFSDGLSNKNTSELWPLTQVFHRLEVGFEFSGSFGFDDLF